MVQEYPAERIRKQVEWLPYREDYRRDRIRNKAGCLIRAIEEDWPAPTILTAPDNKKGSKDWGFGLGKKKETE